MNRAPGGGGEQPDIDAPVGVIIPYSPAHTPGDYLEEAIASVEAQSVPTEVHVVEDDAGRGPAWARNRGLDRVETRLVAFLDADDLWAPDKLARQVARMSRTDSGLCVEGTPMSTDAFIQGVLVGDLSSLTSSILLDTARAPVRFEEELTRFEDHLFIVEAAATAGVCLCPDLVTIRKHEGGLSAAGSRALSAQARHRLAELLAERVPAAEPYLPGVRMRAYYEEGRGQQRRGEHADAMSSFVTALRIQCHWKPLGALLYSGLYRLWP